MVLRKEDGKGFPLAGVLSVVTGYSFQEQGISNVYDICNYMTGESLSTIALVRVSNECTPYILQWYPELKDIIGENGGVQIRHVSQRVKLDNNNWQKILRIFEQRYGKTRILWPIPPDDHDVIDPLEELIAMRGGSDENIITVDVTEDDEISPHGDINWGIDDNEDN